MALPLERIAISGTVGGSAGTGDFYRRDISRGLGAVSDGVFTGRLWSGVFFQTVKYNINANQE